MADANSSSSLYAVFMNVTRHFSDTRTEVGRVRFLLGSGHVYLWAEGQGWHHHSNHADLEEAATFLAILPQVSQSLYLQALNDLEKQIKFEKTFNNAA